MEEPPVPDLRDVELKLGRKVPESLARCLRDDQAGFRLKAPGDKRPSLAEGEGDSALERLEAKIHLLKREMSHLRATDVKLMRQLLIINENIESIKWMMEEKGIPVSRGSSLSDSLCSLLESRDTSLHGSYNSLQDCSDGMDGISVGSYLDTLADIVPGHFTPSDFDQFSDVSVTEDSLESHSLHKRPKNDTDEYLCLG